MFPRVGERRLFHVATPSAEDPRAQTATSAACGSMTKGCACWEPKDQIKVFLISPEQRNPLQAAATGQPRQLLYDVHNSHDADFLEDARQGGRRYFQFMYRQLYSFCVRADQSICARERHKRISRTERGAERQIGRAVSEEATSKWQKSGEASISMALALARAHVLKKKNMRPAVATNTSQRSRQASYIETSKGFRTFVSVDTTIHHLYITIYYISIQYRYVCLPISYLSAVLPFSPLSPCTYLCLMGEVSFTVFVPVAALIQKHWDDMPNVREQKSECTHLHPCKRLAILPLQLLPQLLPLHLALAFIRQQ